ncbi:NAD(P)/FAD-dependent oxidoreductase [Marinomonas algicola]|uniref:NAD(P)/FAD-dependent oxidoreductase n=1 Tax=Marinomonas algicola TaxID=2773454 RepID=UPI001EFF072E|nr:FAD-dependent oxidoreductase [Marinomonas algicola]
MSSKTLKEHLVIVGAGMAGSRLASKVQAEFPDRFTITLIGEEPEAGYNRIMLSSFLAQECGLEELMLIDMEQFLENQGVVIAANPAIDINLNSKQVLLRNGELIHFDKLVMATGSRSSCLSVKGSDADNVIGFRNLQDVSLMTRLKSESRVVVIGGGLLGLEAAVGLVKQGNKVTLLHRAGFLLNRQLDEVSANLLMNRLSSMGIEFRLGASTKAFNILPGQVSQAGSVSLSSGEEIEADLFVVATGIDPEISLAKRAGLNINRAIIVNEFLETSEKNVFAIGECSEFEGQTFGLVAPIWSQLDSLLSALSDRQKAFSVEPVPTKLKVSGVHVFSVGTTCTINDEGVIQYIDHVLNHYRKLIVKDGKLVGAILYGNVADGGWYFQLIQNQTDVSTMLDTLIFGEAYCEKRAA